MSAGPEVSGSLRGGAIRAVGDGAVAGHPASTWAIELLETSSLDSSRADPASPAPASASGRPR